MHDHMNKLCGTHSVPHHAEKSCTQVKVAQLYMQEKHICILDLSTSNMHASAQLYICEQFKQNPNIVACMQNPPYVWISPEQFICVHYC